MREVMEGRVAPAALAALLSALRMKGERPAELVGFARAMREHSVKVSRPDGEVCDTCGTGGDRAGTFNISSAAAIVVAASGARVAKHGNRSVSSRCGSADVFEQLGVNLAAPSAVVERALQSSNIAFFFAPIFHPSMKHAAPTRREMGVRTAFNLLGPLTNPAGATRQVVGVPRADLTDLLARSLRLLGSVRAWVVHGADGIDEISTTGHTKVSECREGAVHTFYIHPSEFGIRKATLSELLGGDAAENAAIVRRVLEGESGAPRDAVGPERGRGAVRGGPRGVHSRGDPRGRVGDRLGRCARDAGVHGEGVAGRGGGMTGAPDLLRTIVAATRQITETRKVQEPVSALERRASVRTPRGDRFEAALGMSGRVNVIAECKRRSPSTWSARTEVRPGGDRQAVRGGRRGGNLRVDRADVLRRRARASDRGPRAPSMFHCCGRTSSSMSISCSRREPPAPMPCCSSSPPSSSPRWSGCNRGRGSWDWPRWLRCMTRKSCLARVRVARDSSASTTGICARSRWTSARPIDWPRRCQPASSA